MTLRARLRLVTLVAPVLLVPRAASGQQAMCTTSKVAVYQSRAVLASIPRYAENDTALNVFVNAYRVELSKLQGVLDSVARAYRDKSAVLTAAARQLELKKVNDHNAQVQSRVQALQQQLARERDKLLLPIETALQAVVDSVRADQKCSAIFDANAGPMIASINKSIDLTQRVIDRIRATGDTAIFGAPVKPLRL